jgi:outer membrane protein assembly factor BamD
MKNKYFQMIGVLLIVFLLIIGCGGKKKTQPVPKDPAVLYDQGTVLFNRGKYKEAIEVFIRLKEYFPSDEFYAPKADLRIADCFFFRKEYPEAIVRYLEFKKQYPFHSDLPYVEYQVGLCHYRQVLSKDRDQKATEKALTAFQNVVANYPDSIFAQKAQEKIVFCRRRLAENDLYVAHFYLRKRKYSAVEKRASSVLAKYPASGVDDQALYYLGFALHKQEKDAEALTPLTLLVEDYPHSPYAKPGKRLLASLKEQGVVAASPVGAEVVLRESMPLEEVGKGFPFRITAQNKHDMLEKNATLYSGNVIALGEETRMRCESLLLTRDADNVPIEMVARDEVAVTREGDEFFCKMAVWSPTQKTLVMTGNAKKRGVGIWIMGDEIILHLDTGKVEIKGEKIEDILESESQ